MQALVERKDVSEYRYVWKLGNYNENPNISIPSNRIHNRIQTVLKCVYFKKTSFSTSSPAIIDFYSLTFILVPTQNRFRIVEIVSRS